MQPKLTTIAMLTLLLLTGCFFGGIDGTGSPTTEGNTNVNPTLNKEIISIGAITQKNDVAGQITVNGVTFVDYTENNVTVNGQASSIEQLKMGQVVTVNGVLSESGKGRINYIVVNTHLKGRITEANQHAHTITVLDQVVRLDDGVVYGDGLSPNTLTVGDRVAISGFYRSSGELSASLVEAVDDNGWIMSGKITDLDTLNETFTINGLLIDYSNLAMQTLDNGLNVNVSGPNEDNGEPYIANQLLIIDITDELENAELVEIEGFAKELIETTTNEFTFTINETLAFTDSSTVYTGGAPANLDEDTRIEVEGTIDVDGTLETTNIIYREASLTSHQSEQKLNAPTQTFIWNNVGAEFYQLQIMNENGDEVYNEVVDSDVSSMTVDNLPEGGGDITVILTTHHKSWSGQKRYKEPLNKSMTF